MLQAYTPALFDKTSNMVYGYSGFPSESMC
jgi:hypothetical protein